MRHTTRRAARVAALTTLAVAGTATSAHAAASATYANGTLTVNGDASAETITVTDTSGGTLTATSSSGISDPDGLGTACAVSQNTATCTGVSPQSVDINGGGSNDTVSADLAVGDASINGGAGNDVEHGGREADSFSAGDVDPGADTITGGSAPADAGDAAYASYLRGGGDPATYQRSTAEDSYGTSGSAALTASLDGVANDGLAGENDNVGADVEELFGGSGNDTLTAGAAAADLFGGAGNDRLTGGGGDDGIYGGGGADTLLGGAGNDSIDDGDTLYQLPAAGQPAYNPGADAIDGGAGDDYITDGLGADDVHGGDGRDTVDAEESTPLNADGTGTSTPRDMAVSLDDVANDGAIGTSEGDNVHGDVEDVTTGAGNDQVVGSTAPNAIDTGAGNDAVTGGLGADDIDTGDGNDAIAAQDGYTDRIDGGRGTDGATVDLPGGQPQRADVVYNVENVAGVAFPIVATPTPVVVNLPPKASISTKTIKSSTFKKSGVLSLKLTTNEPVTATGQAFAPGKLRIAAGDVLVGSGKLASGTGARTLKIKIAKKYATTLKHRLRTKNQRKKGVKIKTLTTVTDSGGLSGVVSRTITIKG